MSFLVICILLYNLLKLFVDTYNISNQSILYWCIQTAFFLPHLHLLLFPLTSLFSAPASTSSTTFRQYTISVLMKASHLVKCEITFKFSQMGKKTRIRKAVLIQPSELNVPESPGFVLYTQVGIGVQESGVRVSFHQQVNMFLGLIKAWEAQLLQSLLDLLSNVVVNVDLRKRHKEKKL